MTVLGEIVTTVFQWDQFCQVVAQSNVFSATTSLYAPCDGRDVTNSALYKVNPAYFEVPDLRGKFIRGVNSNGAPHEGPLTDIFKDPDDRVPNSYQYDAVGKHTHTASGVINAANICFSNGHLDVDEGGDKMNSDIRTNVGIPMDKSVTITVDNYIGSGESRPKNIALCHYIKIN